MTSIPPSSRVQGIRSAALTVSLAAFACVAVACDDKADHPHSTNFVLGDDDTYVKNPSVTLAREYWIIVRAENGTHAMLPRPDGDPRIVEECTTKGPLASLFESAQLCRSATQKTLDRVNNLSADEALQTSTFLHERLRFVAVAPVSELDGAHVEPYPMTDDLLDVCRRNPADRAGVLRSICDEEFRYEDADSRPAIARIYTMAECSVLAPRLNELYGIAQ